MFGKDKGKTWKLANGILLISLIAFIIALLTNLITELLPENGDYTNFVLNDFLFDFLANLSSIVVLSFTLYIINNKVNLFNKDYPLSLKLLNLSFLSVLISAVILLIVYTLNLIFYEGFDVIVLTEYIASILVYSSALYFVNQMQITNTNNGKAQNIFNFISIWGCVGASHGFMLTILNASTFDHPIDFLRNTMIGIMVFAVFATVIYLINFRNSKNEKIN